MQRIKFSKKEISDVIDITDVVEDEKKVYCYTDDKDFWFLHHPGNSYQEEKENREYNYFWIDLHLRLKNSFGGILGFSTFKQALEDINCPLARSCDYELIIFNSQSEVFEYIKRF